MSALSLALLGFNNAAHADITEMDSPRIYTGIGYGQYSFEFEDSENDTDFDDDSQMLKGYIGTQFNKYLSLELAYQNFDEVSDIDSKAEIDGVSLALGVERREGLPGRNCRRFLPHSGHARNRPGHSAAHADLRGPKGGELVGDRQRRPHPPPLHPLPSRRHPSRVLLHSESTPVCSAQPNRLRLPHLHRLRIARRRLGMRRRRPARRIAQQLHVGSQRSRRHHGVRLLPSLPPFSGQDGTR